MEPGDGKIDKPTPIDLNDMNKIEDENEIKEEKNEIKDEIKDENEIKEDNDDIQIDAKELEFIEQPEIEIKTEEDLDKITKDIEKIEINDKLNEETVLNKLKNTPFTKLEILSLNNLELTSLDFLNNECFKTLIVLEN